MRNAFFIAGFLCRLYSANANYNSTTSGSTTTLAAAPRKTDANGHTTTYHMINRVVSKQ